MKIGPNHIMDADEFEPFYTPQENILEDCLRREAERIAHQENLMNRIVYDSVDPSPTTGFDNLADVEQEKDAEVDQ